MDVTVSEDGEELVFSEGTGSIPAPRKRDSIARDAELLLTNYDLGHAGVGSCLLYTSREKLELCEELAPLHNPPADACIDMMAALMPSTPQVAVFDTAFHATMPPKAYMYPCLLYTSRCV